MSKQIFRKLYHIGLLGYVCLFIMALVFYKERVIFIDMAFHLFCIIKDDSVAIQNNRFGSVVTQIFPLLGSRLGLSLNALAIVYSSSFAAYYALCYIICGTVLKQYKIALMLLLSSILFVADGFFWIQSELPQGLAFMMVFFAMLNSLKDKDRKALWLIPVLLGAVVTLVFFHPLLVVPFFFTVLYYYLLGGKLKERKWLVSGAVMLFIAVMLIKKQWFSTAYDTKAVSSLDNFAKYFPNYWNLRRNTEFLELCLHKYQWIPISVIAIMSVLVYHKRWWKLVLFTATFFGMLLVIHVTHDYDGVALHYLENLYLSLGIVLAVPIVADVLPALASSIKRTSVVYALLSIVLITGVFRILKTSEVYAERLDWLRAYMDKYEGKKILAKATQQEVDTLLMTWGTAYELWLLSTIERGYTASMSISDQFDRVEWAWGKRKHFVTEYQVYEYKDLPEQYFHFNDTTSVYYLIKDGELIDKEPPQNTNSP